MSSTPLFGARALADWIRSGGRPQRGAFGYSLQLSWHARLFERNWLAAVRRLEGAALPDDPVFIMGLWRSGTTVLHELLAACTRWTTPRTWQCFNPSTCFLTGPPAATSVVDRPMDQGRIATDGPQEDEFALLLLGEFSAYRAFIDPRRLGECAASLASASTHTLPRWLDFLRGVVAGNAGARLLLKSPGHTFRVPMLRVAFPRARFVWIGRHTSEVLASNVRMWSAMVDRYALWEPPAGALDRFLRAALEVYARTLEECLESVPPESLVWLDFDELRTDPRKSLHRVLQFLEPGGGTDTLENVEGVLARLPIHPGRRASETPDPAAERVERRMAEMRRRFGLER